MKDSFKLPKGFKIPKTFEDMLKCQRCGKKYIPDRNAVTMNRSHTKYVWDRHTYKGNCECFPKTIRICVG